MVDGGADADRVSGGRGDDVLIGGDDADPDVLDGGEGNDTYVVSLRGRDEIRDSDGGGRILLEGRNAPLSISGRTTTHFERVNGREIPVWSNDGYEYRLLDGTLRTGGTLEIREAGGAGGGSLTVHNFRLPTTGSQFLGISLVQPEQVSLRKTLDNPFTVPGSALLPRLVDLDAQQLESDGVKLSLDPGMQVVSEIHLGTRSVHEYRALAGKEGVA